MSKIGRKFGCLMLDLEIANWNKGVLSMLDPNDLCEEKGGAEDYPHITMLYGFHDDEITHDEIEAFLKKHITRPLKVALSNITAFEKDEFDVLKFDIISPNLERLHYMMREEFPCTINFPEYHPHATIAYLKPGTAKKYFVESDGKAEVKLKGLTYSDKDDNLVTWGISDEMTKLPTFEGWIGTGDMDLKNQLVFKT